MPKPEQIPIRRHERLDELTKRIKTREKAAKILKRLLYFIRYWYAGESVERAARRVGITECVGYLWQKRWNEHGYTGGRPSTLIGEQKEQLHALLKNETIGQRMKYESTYGAPSEFRIR
jgi:transposase